MRRSAQKLFHIRCKDISHLEKQKNKLSHKAAHQSGLQQSREESCQEIGPPKNTAWTHLSVRGRKPRTCCG